MVASSTMLTAREWDVLRLVAQGKHCAEVAEALVVSPHTVHTHACHIRLKLGAHTAAHAVYLAMVRPSTSA